jgi:hypothetical protein
VLISVLRARPHTGRIRRRAAAATGRQPDFSRKLLRSGLFGRLVATRSVATRDALRSGVGLCHHLLVPSAARMAYGTTQNPAPLSLLGPGGKESSGRTTR